MCFCKRVKDEIECKNRLSDKKQTKKGFFLIIPRLLAEIDRGDMRVCNRDSAFSYWNSTAAGINMKKDNNRSRTESRRAFCLAIASVAFFGVAGCSTFKGKHKEHADAADFEEDEEVEEDGGKESVFESERKKQSDLSEYVARTGRSSKEKKKASAGETFLLSDKAKEIYANTER